METMKNASAPRWTGEYVLFSYSAHHTVLRVGIAFAHEEYRTVHNLFRNPHNVFVLPYRPPQDEGQLVYRYVVDGMWISDPQNPRTMDTAQDVRLSYYFIPRSREEIMTMELEEAGKHTFTFRSSRAKRVSLAGSFNSWDPYLYRLERVPGTDDLFSLSIALPEGTHYYYFLVDGKRMIDPRNPNRMVSSKGYTVSVIEISG